MTIAELADRDWTDTSLGTTVEIGVCDGVGDDREEERDVEDT